MEKKYRPRLTEGQHKIVMAAKGDRDDIKSFIVLGCIHIPFQNKIILQGIYELMKAYKFNGIVLAGDFLDMGALSDYEKGKISRTGITLKEEYDEGNSVLDKFDSLLDEDATKVFMFGNHCDRYWRWKSDVNNSKYGDLINPIDALKLPERGYKVLADYANDFYNIGSLQVMHGEYYNIHSAKKHLDTFRRNVLYFHTHRIQMFREGDFCAWNAGYLANKTAPCFNYAKRGMKEKWANGFAVVHTDKYKHHVEIVNCINDSFVINGVKYGK